MSERTITVVRIYLREAEHLLEEILQVLHEEEKVAGVTVLRGVMGFSDDGPVRTSFLLALSLDLPLIVEFYDQPAKVHRVLGRLRKTMHLPHVISWSAHSHACD
jgi:uncharacterized protein